MGETITIPANSVEIFPPAVPASIVTDELCKLLEMLKDACPRATSIGFDFDGRLRVHIDMRSRAEIDVIETVLPHLGGGAMFYGLTIGATPHHPFHHRLSARVNR